ncbi:MAG: hypothetical protein C4520_00555 [Candidatus Abyssobacteria bacterium SURF_5]|uniref:Uncharacterized protein n=1 Tax=Abyssobacteria bacterium (strain SURF_5) TaxID=2093360 RepID=A0A3A4P5Y9_ABYX5|nr:MAG: hypothetical protein C4520_00555 [Candidatus Abyssubacteria bacterium SURF_5]
MKKAFVLMVATFLIAGVYAPAAMAFHDDGVAYCGGCHTMHNSQHGQLVDPNSATGNPFLLKDATPSDTCLLCHKNYGQLSIDGQTLGPGGDYYWVTQDVTWTAHSRNYIVEGREHGHNLDAPGNGLTADPVLTTSPGGTYNATYMGCNSCHDPHGEDSNDLLLYGVGATAANYVGGFNFTNAAPAIIDNGRSTTLTGSAAEKLSQHTAYLSGMSDWCANCHAGMHSGMTSNLVHPVDVGVGTTLSNNYNAYVTTGNMTGAQATAYLPLVPFEDAANTTTSTTGTTSASRVMCLTCHRAHASPYPDAGRWDFAQTELTESHPAGEPYLAQYSGAPLDMTVQRSLCNKCHAKD